MNILKNKMLILSHRINKILCLSLVSFKRTSAGVKFCEEPVTWFYVLRFILYMVMFTVGKLPRYIIYFNNLWIVRLVYVVATFILYFYLFYEFYLTITKRKNFANIMNGIVKIYRDLKLNDEAYFKIFILYEFCFISAVALVLIHQDYMRENLWDTFGYTLPEILCLKSIFLKAFLIAFFNRALLGLNAKAKTCGILHMEKLTKTYQKLIYMAKEINELYGLTYLIISVQTFIWTIYNLYKIIILYQNYLKFPSPNITMSWCLSVVWIFLHAYHLTKIIYFCNKIQENASDFKSIINARFCKLSYSEARTNAKIVSI